MKALKKILVVLLSIVLVCCLSFLILSFSIHTIVIDQVRNVTLEKVKEDIASESDISMEKLDNFFDNPDVNDLVEKYIDVVIAGIAFDDSLDDLKIKEDIINFIDNNREFIKSEFGITDLELDLIRNSNLLGDVDTLVKDEITEASVDEETVKIIRIYSDLVSNTFKIILGVSIVVLIGIIGLLSFSISKVLKTSGICFITSSILSGAIMGFILYAINTLEEVNLIVDYVSGLLYSIITLILGILLIVISHIYKKKVS